MAIGIDRYVIRQFYCGASNDVTVDSITRRSSTFNLVRPLYLLRYLLRFFCDFTMIPGQVFLCYQFVQP